MKKNKIMLFVLVAMAVLVIASVAYASPAASQNWAVPLSGDAERPDPRDTRARGVATFKLSKDGTELSFKLNVANIENVVAAHIHCGPVESTGPVGVTLFGALPAGGRTQGTLAEGTITMPDPGNACGWTNLAAVVAAMNGGNTYVNVHTNDGVPPPNTGPGDFPPGEIRGQIK